MTPNFPGLAEICHTPEGMAAVNELARQNPPVVTYIWHAAQRNLAEGGRELAKQSAQHALNQPNALLRMLEAEK